MTDCLRDGCGHPLRAHAGRANLGHCRWCVNAHPIPKSCSWFIAPAVAPRQWDEVAEYHDVHLMTEPDERCAKCDPRCERCDHEPHPDTFCSASCLCGWTGTLD